MWKKALLTTIILVTIPILLSGTSFTINEIRSDNQMQGAELGLEMGPLVITVGVDAMYLKATALDTTGMIAEEDLVAEVEGAVLFPSVGLKILLGSKPSRFFLKGTISKFMPLLEVSAQVGSEELVTPEMKKLIEESLEAFEYYGGKVGFGVEHRFDNRLALIGEFGIRYHIASLHLFENEENGASLDVGALVGTTYTALGVGFFF